MKSIDESNVIDIKSRRLLQSAATVVKLRAPIAVKIRGRELPVVQVARQTYKKRSA